MPQAPEVETAAMQLLRKAWNWLMVGEEYRRKDVAIEFAVATHWLMRLGILILVAGLGFFIKYSIDHEYLGPVGRVSLSILAGACMLGGGLLLFGKRYHVLGQGLAGGGVAVLYFSLYAAGSHFKIIPLGFSFAGMALITLVSATLAVRFRSLLIALLGLLGGYLTPVLLNTGIKNFPGLYGYLLLLGLGMLGVSWKRRWPIITWTAFLCHSLIVGVSLARFFVPADFPLVMGFLIAFFLLFSTAVFIYNVATRTVASLLELAGLFLAATVFFGFGYWIILGTWPGQDAVAAWLALGLCAYYVLHLYALQRRGVHDKGLQTVFLGLGAVFLSITLPLLLSRGWLTVTWAMEALVLLWMGMKLRSPVLRILAALLYAVVIGRIGVYDLAHGFRNAPPDSFRAYLGILFPRLVQFGMSILSLAGAWRLLKEEKQASPLPDQTAPATGWLPGLALVLTYGLLFLYLNLEVVRFCASLYPPLVHPGRTLVWISLGAVFLFYRKALGKDGLAVLWSLLLLAVFIKLVVVDMQAWEARLAPIRYGIPYTPVHALIRLLDFGMMIGFAGVTFRLLRPQSDLRALALGAGWLALALLLLYLTLELGALLHAFLPAFHGGGISLLWAVFAFALVFAGLRNRTLPLRLAGLALFIVVLGKIGFSDLAHLEAIYRVIALIALGVVLLLASYLYIKNTRSVEPS